jgi:hypothetical protein
MSLSSINIVLGAITEAYNASVNKAAETMDRVSKRMQKSADQASKGVGDALGSGQLRQKIESISSVILEQKDIYRDMAKELEDLRQKRDAMSKSDVQGQKAVRAEIERTKNGLKEISRDTAELTAKKQALTQQLSATNQSLGGTRAALNGLAASFSAVSSVVGIMAEDNKALRNTLMALNAALNFSAAIMQVKDLQEQFGGLTKFLTNPWVLASIAIAAAGAAIYAYSTRVSEAEQMQRDLNKEFLDATKSAKQNEVALMGYLAIVNDTTRSETERKGALLALKEAGIAVDDINIRTAKGLKILNDRTRDSIDLSIQKAIADRASAKIAEIEIAKIERLNNLRENGASILNKFREMTLPGFNAQVYETNQAYDEAEALTALYTNALKNAQGAIATLTARTMGASDAQKSYNNAVKTGAKTAAKDLEDLNKQVASEFKRHELEKIKIADDASRLALEKQKLSQTNLLEQLKTDQLLEIDAIKSKYNDQIQAKKILDKELEKQVTTKIGVDGNKLTEGQVQALINQRKNISDEIIAIEQNMATAIENTTNGQIKATNNLLDLQLKERQSYNAEVYGLTLDLVNSQTDLENKSLAEKLKQYGFTENEISKLLTKRKNEASERFEQNAAKLESDRAYFQELANIYNDDTLTQKQRAKEIENLNNSRVAKNLSIELDLLKQKQIAGEEETQLYKERAAKIAEIEAQMASNSVAIVESTNKKLQASLTQINAAFATLQTQAAVSFGQFLGDLVSGDQDAGKNFGKNMLGAIAAFMDSLGKALVATAIASEAFQKLILTNPIAAAAAGIALIAGAAVVRNSLKEGPNVTAFADGGIVSGPTLGLMGEYPGASTNPEVIAPLDKLKSLMKPSDSGSGFIASTHVSGRDLAIVLNRYNKDNQRG